MTWPSLMTSAFVGLAASMVAVVFTAYQGVRYQRWLPKRDVSESLDALKLHLAEKREEYEELREALYAANDTIRRAEDREKYLELTEERLLELQTREKELRDVEGDLAQKLEQQSIADEKLERTSTELRGVEGELQRQQSQLLSEEEFTHQQASQQQLMLDIRNSTAELKTLETAVGDLEEELELQQAEHDGLRDESDRIRVEKQGLLESVRGLEERRDSLEKHLEELKQESQQLAGPNAAIDEDKSTELLWEPIIVSKQGRSVASLGLSEDDALDRAEAYIKDSGLIYDRRVLRAFHTSLKCSEESPLLVLAGISGTGKSALPTRYAEAMGMHFLNVPVQPGWDSPADLLGFYNHLERRFRPTELTRAMLQLDFVHKAKSSGSTGDWPESACYRTELGDQMLLVLLDEMNLARVEYYFSEFLSRLETRRDIDPSDAIDRMKAELVLDLGTAGKENSQSIRVFPGNNVLFVGTMNEDESTQTLSDKVIDRSNLMRFGKPNRLVLTDEKHDRILQLPEYLPRPVWRGWVDKANELAGGDAATVKRWTDQVNDHLAGIGRPFAHRVAKAIQTYVRHYPDKSEMGLCEAFADQVELRVLPRLRGLDIHDPSAKSTIFGITQLVESELQDQVLSSALEDAMRQAGDQLFHWSGVDRLRPPVTP